MTDHELIIALCILSLIVLLICLWALGKILDTVNLINSRTIAIYRILSGKISTIENETYRIKLSVDCIDRRLRKKESKKKLKKQLNQPKKSTPRN